MTPANAGDVNYLLWIGFAMLAMTGLTSLAARRLHAPQAILLVVVGAVVAFLPGVPVLELDPDLVLQLLLPPLLYTSGVGMSWRGFRDNLRPILLLAIGCVLFTAVAVAAVAHWLLNIPWAVGLVLGAVVSPPDAVAPMAIARRLAVPRRILTVLEGEGLVNDATALILFSFAVGAVVTGSASIPDAVLTFGVIVVTETLWGLAVAWAMLRLRHWSRDPEIEILFSILTPFIAFWPPHLLGGSGVLAAVTAGLYTSWNGPGLISAQTRLQGFFFWGLVTYVIEGVVFFLTGLQSTVVAESFRTGNWQRMVGAATLTVLVVMVVRFVWVFPASYLPGLLKLSTRESRPTWRGTFLVGFTGIRGVVSLVAALSIPDLAGAKAFPERDLIMFVTFCVIVVTLIGQGALLPHLIRWLKLDQAGRREAELAKREEVEARVEAIERAMVRLEELSGAGVICRTSTSLRRWHEARRLDFLETADETIAGAPAVDTAALQLQLIEAERASIAARHAAGRLTDDARRRVERELDLEDARVRHAADSATGAGFEEL